MTSPNAPDELGYHLRELRADLRLAHTVLRTAASSENGTALLRPWIEAESLLDHDLKVHLPRARALLERAPLPPSRPTDDESQNGDDLLAIASGAARLVERALLELGGEGTPPEAGLAAAGQAIAAAHRHVRRALDLAIRQDREHDT